MYIPTILDELKEYWKVKEPPDIELITLLFKLACWNKRYYPAFCFFKYGIQRLTPKRKRFLLSLAKRAHTENEKDEVMLAYCHYIGLRGKKGF